MEVITIRIEPGTYKMNYGEHSVIAVSDKSGRWTSPDFEHPKGKTFWTLKEFKVAWASSLAPAEEEEVPIRPVGKSKRIIICYPAWYKGGRPTYYWGRVGADGVATIETYNVPGQKEPRAVTLKEHEWPATT